MNAEWAGMNALSNALGHPEIYKYLASKGAVLPSGYTEPWWASDKPPFVRVRQFSNMFLARWAPPDAGTTIHRANGSGYCHSLRALHAERAYNTLFTTGMCDKPMTVPKGKEEFQFAELVLQLPPGKKWRLDEASLGNPELFWPIEWMRRITLYPHQNKTWLGAPVTIIANDEPPQPFAANTQLSCMGLFLEMSDIPTATLNDGRVVQFYTMMPLYAEERERELELKSGWAHLVKTLQKNKVSRVLDPVRPSVARKRSK